MALPKKTYQGIDNEEDLKWEELRALFIGDQQAYIQQITEFLQDREKFAKEIGRNLPNALRVSHSINPELARELIDAVQPILEQAIEQSARENTHELSDHLQPIFGPAIRKSINDTFRRMDQSFNSILLRTISLRGVKYRIEAWRTGRSFSEVMISHSLTFKVKEIFLIHGETGLLIQHVAQKTQTQDADMMSAMLKAIQDFVNDSFMSEDEGDSQLGAVEFGGQKIYLEQGRHVVLAAVVSGTLPEFVLKRFTDAVAQIEKEYRQYLREFDGEVDVFDPAREILKTCFYEGKDETGKKKKKTRLQRGLIRTRNIVLILAILIVLIYPWAERTYRWQKYLDHIVELEGVILVEETRKNGQYYIAGMRTPTSPNPPEYLKDYKFSDEDVVSRWMEYRPYNTKAVVQKAERVLRVPVGVQLSLKGDTLIAEGFANRMWLKTAESKLRDLWEVNYLKTDKLTAVELEDPEKLARRIENSDILFHLESSSLTSDELDKAEFVARDIQNLINTAAFYKKDIEVIINGYTDGTGDKTFNQQLSEARALTVYNFLLANGISSTILKTIGHGFDKQQAKTIGIESKQSLRKVKLKIVLKDS